MNFLVLGVSIVLVYGCNLVSGDFEFETEKFIPNEPTTIRTCTQRHKNLHIFDSLRSSSFCNRLSESCRAVAPVAGIPAGVSEFPHIAAIGWLQSDNTTLWDCGGILITNTFVLTAGHCTYSKRFESAPKFVRLGELRVANTTQLFGVARIIKHPNYKYTSHYDDIALIELDGAVELDRFVVPACLWPTYDFNFEKMDAAGWGLDQTGGERVEVLTKVTLGVVENSKCDDYYPKRRKLKNGLRDTQLCAGDPVMDTCQGDSGGPLEIKLYAKTKLIPFVVGITSFGSACGAKIPGVYTRISSYIPWIESMVNETFDPLRCSIRNINYRNYDYVKYSNNEDLEFSVSIFNEKYQDVKCGGSVIDSQFVLASASCFTKIANGVVMVKLFDGTKIKVKTPQVHMMYDEFYNDLVLIKLENKIKLQKMDQLVCPAPFHLELSKYESHPFSSEKIDHYLARSFGPKLFYEYVEDLSDVNNLDFNTMTYINIRSRPVPFDDCSKRIKKISNITGIDDKTQICAGNARFAVPGTCTSDAGGPWIMEGLWDGTFGYITRIPYLVGVQSFGVDCGFGVPAVATNVTSFIPWIDSILYPEKRIEETKEPQEIREEFEKCTSKNYVKQPQIEPDWQGRIYHAATFESTVLLGFYSTETFDDQWLCDGVIISPKVILTTARCVKSMGSSAVKIMLSPTKGSSRKIVEATMHHIHPGYSSKSGQNDIALVVTDTLALGQDLVSACLWYNTTHLPYELRKVVFTHNGSIEATALDMNPANSEDCVNQFDGDSKISANEFCAALDMEYRTPECTHPNTKSIINAALCSSDCQQQHGETLLHFAGDQDKVTAVVVGLSSASNFCDPDKPLVFTRISAYAEWIDSKLKLLV